MRNLECFGGDDCTLIYYHRCLDCGTVILEDHSNPACLKDWECPTCNPKDYFEFKYFTKEEIEQNEALKTYLEYIDFI
jgi:hypothetical protein